MKHEFPDPSLYGRKDNVDASIDKERSVLENNLQETSDNMEEFDDSPPSRQEKVLAYLTKKIAKTESLPVLVAIGMAAGDTYNGRFEEALITLGIGAIASVSIKTIMTLIQKSTDSKMAKLPRFDHNEKDQG